ncbi:MAG: SIS domain-containing protein [Candidatus Binatia bacterium]
MRQRVDPTDFVLAYRERSVEVLSAVPADAVSGLIEILAEALKDGRHVFICGNGGSAATASHFAAGLGKDSSAGRERKFRVLSLTDNVPWITSLANDHHYSEVFAEQLKNFAQPGDVLIAFSGSGNSANIIRAIEWANDNGLLTVGISGRAGGKLGELARHAILIDSAHMGHIEEAHFLIQHLVSYYFEEAE